MKYLIKKKKHRVRRSQAEDLGQKDFQAVGAVNAKTLTVGKDFGKGDDLGCGGEFSLLFGSSSSWMLVPGSTSS